MSNESKPLAECEVKELCEELSRRSPEGVYVLMLEPPFETKEISLGVYYKVKSIDGVAKIIGHTLMWFMGKTLPSLPTQDHVSDEGSL